jgi:zinc/manganese transport system ATP-binding protein
MIPAFALEGATLRFGPRPLWVDVDLAVAPGEFLAVLGPNGAGKTTLLQVLLGVTALTSGSVRVLGADPARARRRTGYIPQQKGFDADLAIRGRDLVSFGVDGHLFGLRRASRRARAVDEALANVGATSYASAPVGLLSGGEQQRLRVAQALLAEPELLLCDEPLLSLDLASQEAICRLIDARRRDAGSAVVFVTHDVNPILAYVDRILYFVDGRWPCATPDVVLTSDHLSGLYGTAVDVLDVHGRLVVVTSEPGDDEGGHHHHGPAPVRRPIRPGRGAASP